MNIKGIRVNNSILDILRITDTYSFDNTYLTFLNRWNPFTYILLILPLAIAPFYCMFTSISLQDVFKEVYDGIKGECVLEDKNVQNYK